MHEAKICVLEGGSKGNSTFVKIEQTRILLDVGISGRKAKKKLKTINEDISLINYILLTHEHQDHSKGIGTITKKHATQAKVILNYDTFSKLKKTKRRFDAEFFDTGDTINLTSNIQVITYEISHDGVDPVAYRIDYKNKPLLGYLKDCGLTTTYLEDAFSKIPIIIIESNHDYDMLISGDYPDFLKIRVLNSHLSNSQAISFINRIKPDVAILSHLSENNNTIPSVVANIEEKKKVDNTFFVIVPANDRSPILKWEI